MRSYDHKEIEAKWRKRWEDEQLYRSAEDEHKEKCYVLDMFPYPSGAGLHVGHPKGYIATDVYARHKRMQGYNVLHPMGWDAFGLPAENYALKNKVHPNVAVKENVARFKEQLEKIGFDYDWEREINTTDPAFYKWTQWAFVQMFKKGLAYESYEPINWCPSCKTGLANEDLDGDRCERCDSVIEKKPMRQWVLRITDYADRLLKDLDTLPWAEHVKEAQRNWIGRSEGALLRFNIKMQIGKRKTIDQKVNIVLLHGFTGRADKNFIPWLKTELEGRGYAVQAPQLPNTDAPSEDEQVAYVLDHCNIDENTVLVGHSLGGVVAMKVIEKLSHAVAGLVLVAPAVEPAFRTGEPRNFWDTFNISYDYDTITAKTGFRTVLSDTLEKERRGAYLAHLALKIDAPLLETAAHRVHFRANEEPFVLESILNTLVAPTTYNLLPTNSVEVFTTRPDTLYGATYVVLAPEHKLVAELIANEEWGMKNRDEVRAYIEKAKNKTEIDRTAEGKEKTGVKLEGVTAVNPANGEELPIFIADYVLAGYGTGAIMAVPAHDERDFAFAKKYGLPIHTVIQPKPIVTITPTGVVALFLNDGSEVLASKEIQPKLTDDALWTRSGVLVDSGPFTGMDSEEAKVKITEHAGGKMTTQYRLQDWVFARQRYWGEPIPIIHCEKCGAVPVPESDLPVMLPEVESYESSGTGESPLANITDWVNTTCPQCGGAGKRETNTMPQWAGSSWYYLRYIDPHNDKALVNPAKEKYWSPVDVYVGGMEHATRHLIYARFWHKFLYDIGVVHDPEPFQKLYTVGLIMAEDGRKMSKRWGNVINPDDMIDRMGADALRVYEMFMGPFGQSIAWSTDHMVGARRFLERVYGLREKVESSEKKEERIGDSLLTTPYSLLLNQSVKKVGDDIEAFNFNTAVSQMMVLVNALEKLDRIPSSAYSTLILLLAPFAPHVAEELWESLGHTTSVHLEPWPTYDEAVLASAQVTIAVQVNGKVRDTFTVAPGTAKEELLTQARALPKIGGWLEGKQVVKEIVVPGRLVNFVIGL